MQLRNDNSVSMFVFYNPRVFCCKPASYSLISLIQEAENKMMNTNLITNIFPPKSLLCHEDQRVQKRTLTFTYFRGGWQVSQTVISNLILSFGKEGFLYTRGSSLLYRKHSHSLTLLDGWK